MLIPHEGRHEWPHPVLLGGIDAAWVQAVRSMLFVKPLITVAVSKASQATLMSIPTTLALQGGQGKALQGRNLET